MTVDASTGRKTVLRRVQVLFTVTVVIPIIFVAGVFYYQVRSILEDQGYVRLRDATRFNGSYLVQRLLQSSEQLRDLQK
ncbi:MAG: hypothetical protein R3228_11385, partial [Halioglobus sp.]|nr:hypothetical protein [Halioglobus sp.]